MRIAVSLVVNLVVNGMTVDEIVEEYSELEPEDIHLQSTIDLMKGKHNMLNHSYELYGGPTKEITPDKAQKQDVTIHAIEERRYGSEKYPTITFYKLVQVGTQYKFYTYVDDTNSQRWAEREDELPFGYSYDQAMNLWEKLTEYMKEGATIGSWPVLWEVALDHGGHIIGSLGEDWESPKSYLLG